ncbi:hypothetical protein [uncultured Oscillibacter sp.]|uniref:hypothetical protein n=1 Tax=uncultured Oscillibacter sp. TaxID=876091 RepID=UPI00345C92B6
MLAKAVKGATDLPLGAGGFIHGITSFRSREKRVISPFITPQQKEFENCQRLQRVFQKKFEINAKKPD